MYYIYNNDYEIVTTCETLEDTHIENRVDLSVIQAEDDASALALLTYLQSDQADNDYQELRQSDYEQI